MRKTYHNNHCTTENKSEKFSKALQLYAVDIFIYAICKEFFKFYDSTLIRFYCHDSNDQQVVVAKWKQVLKRISSFLNISIICIILLHAS
jgi:hypothetical protein